MKKTILLLCIGFFCFFSLPSISLAEQRVALVIGNSKYAHVKKLSNPLNDAGDIADVLQELGFDVFQGIDLTLAGFDRILRKFAAALADADVALLFYAGHGVSLEGTNYLIPVDTQLTAVRDITRNSVSLRKIQELMERRPRINLLFFDACRDNPFLQELARSAAGREAGLTQGWTDVAPSHGTYISFASAEGAVASDGNGRNSPFTAALLRHIRTAGQDVQLMMREVRKDVIQATNNTQVPWEKTSMVSRFVFAQPAGPAKAEFSLTSNKTSYRKGEAISLSITPPQDCRLTLLNVDNAGKSCLLFPHPRLPDEILKAGQTYTFPPKGALRLDEPGEESFVAMCNASAEATSAAGRNSVRIDCSRGAADRQFNDRVFETVTFDLDEKDTSPTPQDVRTVLQKTLTVTVSDQ